MRYKLQAVLALVLGLFAAAVLTDGARAASAWPTRPVKFILTLGAGSGSDIGARLFADRLSRKWGQPVIVENRPGGDGLVAINAFVSAHDDHVLLFAPSSSFTAHPFLHDKLPYKPSDLLPIVRVSNTFIVIAVPKELKIDTLADLVKRARAEPGKLNWAGVTGALDFLFAGWLKDSGLQMTKVPYRNPVDAAKDLGENRVQAYESALAIVQPQLDSGKITLLAVTNTQRTPAQPNVPTVQEAGFPALTIDWSACSGRPACRSICANELRPTSPQPPMRPSRIGWRSPGRFSILAGPRNSPRRSRISAPRSPNSPKRSASSRCNRAAEFAQSRCLCTT